MRRIITSFFVLLCSSCGLLDDGHDDAARTDYLRFADPAFESFCLETLDLDGDGRISRYEAERIVRMDCSGWGIASLGEISDFRNLQRLDCSDNELTRLDVGSCPRLVALDCSGNSISWLDVEGLALLSELNCRDNLLSSLDLRGDTSLSTLECGGNVLRTLDVSGCATTMERVDTQSNPQLETLYKGAAQEIRVLSVDSHTDVVSL